MSNILGIDLGTTNSVGCVWKDNDYRIVKNNNSLFFPSIIEFTENAKLVSNVNNLNNSIVNIKRLIGHNLDNITLYKYFSDVNYDYELKENNIYFYNKYENKHYTIEELNALILKNIIKYANKQFSYEFKDVVITIPAHFNQNQRDSINISAKIAKLNCVRIINEPIAASLAYGLIYHNDINLLAFDLGGGTLDLSIVNIDDGIYEVIHTYGDNFLGGEDFTNLILKDVIKKFKDVNKFYKINDNIIKNNIIELKRICENFKCGKLKNIKFENFYEDIENNIRLDIEYCKNRNELKELFTPLLNKIKEYIDLLINESNMSIDDINYIVMVGGSSNLIEVKELLHNYFKKELLNNINPELVVSIGAAIQGYTINNPDDNFSQNLALVDILPLSIGVESENGKMTKIIEKGCKIPITKTKYFCNSEDNQSEIDINIYQGERLFIKDNILIDTFVLKNLKLKEKGKNIIKIDISIDNNCMIKVVAYEKGTKNSSEVVIKKKNSLSDEEINKMILDSEKYDDLDNLNIKLNKVKNKLNQQISNLNYNCHYNNENKFSDDEKKTLSNFIIKLIEKQKTLNKMLNNNLSNKEIENIIHNYKKLIKINDKKYKSLTDQYNIDIDLKNEKLSSVQQVDDNKNNELKKFISVVLNNIKLNNDISQFVKKQINKYLININYKLDSKNIDNNELQQYVIDINENIENYKNEDIQMVKKYGNVNKLSEVINENNLNINILNLDNYDSLELFDLLYEISVKYNLEI